MVADYQGWEHPRRLNPLAVFCAIEVRYLMSAMALRGHRLVHRTCPLSGVMFPNEFEWTALHLSVKCKMT